MLVPANIDAEKYPAPIESAELAALSAAFVATCQQADALLPASYPGTRPFRGGFDEVIVAVEFIPQVPELAQVKNRLDAINAAWQYACQRCGIATAAQWRKMWEGATAVVVDAATRARYVITKTTVLARLRVIGKSTAFLAMLKQDVEAEADWIAYEYIVSDNPTWLAYKDAFSLALGMTAEEVAYVCKEGTAV